MMYVSIEHGKREAGGILYVIRLETQYSISNKLWSLSDSPHACRFPSNFNLIILTLEHITFFVFCFRYFSLSVIFF